MYSNHFKNLRSKWQQLTLGNYHLETCSAMVRHAICAQDKRTMFHMSHIDLSPTHPFLWADESCFSISQTHTNNYLRLLDMTKSYKLKGSPYYQDATLLKAIRYGLQLLHQYAYNQSFTPYYDNWWNWEIGSPLALGSILTLLYEELSSEELSQYTDVILHFQPDPKYSSLHAPIKIIPPRISVGGNRVDRKSVV